MDKADNRTTFLAAIAIFGASIAMGLGHKPLSTVILLSLAIGISLNLFLMVLMAIVVGRHDRVMSAALMSIPAGFIDAMKIIAIAVAISWISRPPVTWIEFVLIVQVFFIMLNVHLHGSMKAIIDACLVLLWMSLFVAVLFLNGWRGAVRFAALSIAYGAAVLPVARAVAVWSVNSRLGTKGAT